MFSFFLRARVCVGERDVGLTSDERIRGVSTLGSDTAHAQPRMCACMDDEVKDPVAGSFIHSKSRRTPVSYFA